MRGKWKSVVLVMTQQAAMYISITIEDLENSI